MRRSLFGAAHRGGGALGRCGPFFGRRCRAATPRLGARCHFRLDRRRRSLTRFDCTRRRRLARLVFARLGILALADALLALRRPALALCIVEQDALPIELKQRSPPLATHLLHAGRDCEALRAVRLGGARPRDDVGAFTLDATALCSVIVGRVYCEHWHEQQHQQAK